MHVLFVHQNFPAQFGHIAAHLVTGTGLPVHVRLRAAAGRRRAASSAIQYQLEAGPREHNHYCTPDASRTPSGTPTRSTRRCKARPDIRPDLIVGHCGFGSTLFLRELYDCPIINYFEYFYRPRDTDMDFRPEFPAAELDLLRRAARNAMILLDLENCDAGYSPHALAARACFPAAYRRKIARHLRRHRHRASGGRHAGCRDGSRGRAVGPGTRIVTYVSRGIESMRGFDIFMKVAKRICAAPPTCCSSSSGTDRVCYGGDLKLHRGRRAFKECVLEQDDYDLSKFLFLGRVPPPRAGAAAVAERPAHLPDGAVRPVVVAARRPGVRVHGAGLGHGAGAGGDRHGENGLLADFFDVEGLADLAHPGAPRPRGAPPAGAGGDGADRGGVLPREVPAPDARPLPAGRPPRGERADVFPFVPPAAGRPAGQAAGARSLRP